MSVGSGLISKFNFTLIIFCNLLFYLRPDNQKNFKKLDMLPILFVNNLLENSFFI